MPIGGRTRYYAIRPRRLPPEFCTDELLESCSLLATLLLYRLISQADDQGRLPGHAKYVKAVCFPMRAAITERKVADALDKLVGTGFLIRYAVDGRHFVQVDRWFDLQGKWAQRRTYPSRYPAPPGWTSDWVNAGSDAPEVPALGAHGACDVRPPLSPTSAPSSTASLPGLSSAAIDTRGPERIGDLLERGRRGQLTDEEAMELGSMLASVVQSNERVR